MGFAHRSALARRAGQLFYIVKRECIRSFGGVRGLRLAVPRSEPLGVQVSARRCGPVAAA